MRNVNCQISHFISIMFLNLVRREGEERGENKNKGQVRNWGERGQGGSEGGEEERAITLYNPLQMILLHTCTLSYTSSSAGSCQYCSAIKHCKDSLHCNHSMLLWNTILICYTQSDSLKPESHHQSYPLLPVSSKGYLTSDWGLYSKVSESGQLQIND